jgi:hypothetical protein
MTYKLLAYGQAHFAERLHIELLLHWRHGRASNLHQSVAAVVPRIPMGRS